MEQFTLRATDNVQLHVRVYDAPSCKGVVQLIHGMEEHQARYEDFATFLNERGYSVVSSDMRGHGEAAEKLGWFKEKDGYRALVDDQKTIRNYISERYGDLPVYLMAHSMGTIVSRVLLQTDSGVYKKVALSGAPNYQAATPGGLVLANVIGLFRGGEYKSPLLENISLKAFNKGFQNPRTEFDWLSTNEAAVDKYLADPYCGKGFTCSAYKDLYRLLLLMHKAKEYKNVNKDLPIAFFSGAQDVCTGGEKGLQDSVSVLKKAGFTAVSRKEYQGMRHEILGEKDNIRVYTDIAEYFDS